MLGIREHHSIEKLAQLVRSKQSLDRIAPHITQQTDLDGWVTLAQRVNHSDQLAIAHMCLLKQRIYLSWRLLRESRDLCNKLLPRDIAIVRLLVNIL